ncbi:amidohydrolase family protein, partial [Pelagibacteraceae bacterium]|nr:amidohydrolase family protein [Pelagibacteraceae bacterium]
GVHLEGPFINPNKLGAQPNLTEKPSLEFIKKILEISDVKIITLAPEIDGMQEFINDLVELNIKIQFGHTLADFDCCEKIMKDHEIGFTHLYNAMSGNDHRFPGVLSAALSKGKYAEIICDNIHVSKEAIKIAKKCIPGLYTITDSINASGLSDGEYIFAKNNIKKENDSVKIKSDGTLAGSIVTMDQTFKNLISMDFSLEEAVALTSYNASKYLNLDNVGIIQKNFLSNFLVLDKEFNLKEVYLRGKKINV